jgi:high-affinity Fe2+/Pb2+ permease
MMQSQRNVVLDSNAKAGLTLAAVALIIIAGLLILSSAGNPFMLWADVIFGFIALGLLLLGIYQIEPSRLRSE